MNRRQFLVGSTSIALGVTAGCTDSNTESPSGGNSQTSPTSVEQVRKPPYEIQSPEDTDAWNEHYLGENMATEPSVPFGEVPASLNDSMLESNDNGSSHAFVTYPIETKSEMDNHLTLNENADEVNFDEAALIVVESGYGSSSYYQRWVRAEDMSGAGVHLFGYYFKPEAYTQDFTSYASVLKVGKDVLEGDGVRASLTVDADHQVTFAAADGVVGLDF